MGLALPVRATVPAPPANQQIGMPDGVFNNLEEIDCRLCHENPDQFPVDDFSIPDRHHLLHNTPIGTPDSSPFADPPGNFDCFSCHDVDCGTGVCNVNVYRDCLFCHQQAVDDASVHHLTATALSGDCVFCHGDIVDNMDDGHIILSYEPSSATPTPSGGDGLPLNIEGNGAGACNYCHSTGTGTADPGTDMDTGIFVYKNSTTHHTTILSDDFNKCEWCHDMYVPIEFYIRACEGCHGYESLHNIQVDSDGDGAINPGIELPFYGHIGNPDDCWGCHGFSLASTSSIGPLTPIINSSDVSVIEAGTDTVITLTGSTFTSFINGLELVSNVVLTAPDGSSVELTPDSVTHVSMTVTVPGILAAGNYDLRASKDTTESNPVVISVIPDVIITNVDCSRKKGLITITGSGFTEKIEGTDDYINVEVNGKTADIISWTNTRIRASVSRCSSNDQITVNSLFGSAVSSGKPPKPCKGKGCNK